MRFIQLLAGLAIALAIAADGAGAQDAVPAQGGAAQGPITVFTRDPQLYQGGGPADQLLQKANQEGEVRVIVGVNMPMTDEDGLSPAEQTSQAQALAAMQDEVLGRALGRTGGGDIVKFGYVAALSVFANAAQLSLLLSDPNVVNIAEDVPLSVQGYNLTVTDTTEVQKLGQTGNSRLVAVLDTGVQADHPVLAGKVQREACFSTNDKSGAVTSFCKGGVTRLTGAGSAIYCPLSIAGCGHGTNVASIAVGSGAVNGFATSANLVAIQVFSQGNSVSVCGKGKKIPCSTAYATDIMQGLEYVYSQRGLSIAAVNMSLGFPQTQYPGACDAVSPSVTAAIAKLKRAQIFTVVSAGNEKNTAGIDFPACISKAIAVASSDSKDVLSNFSNYSPQVKLIAPGTEIYDANPVNSYAKYSGTSQAAPAVSGALAILREASPSAPLDLLVDALVCGGQPIAANNLTRERIDTLRAYDYLQQPPTETDSWGFDARSAKLFTELLGDWGASGSNYKLQSFNPIGYLNAAWFPHCASSVTVTATMTRHDQNPVGCWNSGIVITSEPNAPNGSVDQNNAVVSGYYFLYNQCQMAGIFRLDSQNLDTLAGSATELCESKELFFRSIKKQKPNTLQATVSGGKLVFKINGKTVCTATDSTYTKGSVMILAAAPNPPQAGQSLEISSLEIQSPGFKPDPEDEVDIAAAEAASHIALPMTSDPEEPPQGQRLTAVAGVPASADNAP